MNWVHMTLMRVTTAQEIINHNIKTYARIASGFDETRKVIDWPMLKSWTQALPRGARIADIGCGSGRLLRYVKERGVRYIGIDPVNTLLDRARATASREGVADAELYHGNLLELPLEDQSCDVVFCVAALHHIPSREFRLRACKELFRVLRPGGKLFLTAWNMWRSGYRWLVLDTLLRKWGMKKTVTEWDRKLEWNDVWVSWNVSKTNEVLYRYYHSFTKRELRMLIEDAGFVIDRIGIDGSDRLYSGKGWNWIVEARRM